MSDQPEVQQLSLNFIIFISKSSVNFKINDAVFEKGKCKGNTEVSKNENKRGEK